METTIKKILEDALLGKVIEVTTYNPVNEKYKVDVKKSNNVTNKQFESGDKKYRMTIERTRLIDNGKKVEKLKIVKIEDLFGDNDYECVIVALENGQTYELTFNEKIELF